jgi:hypothetical protein
VFTLIFALWYAGPATEALAAYRLARNGLAWRFPTLWLLLVAFALQSAVLIYFRRQPAQYAYVYAFSSVTLLLMEAFAIVGVFWVVTEKYPNFGRPGVALLSGLAVLGAVACWMTRFLAVPPHWSAFWQIAVLIERYVTLVMTVVLLGSRVLLPIVPRIPIRASARRASDILTIYALFGLASSAVTVGAGGRFPWAASLLPVLGGVVTPLLCAFWLTPASDECGDFAPVTEKELLESEAAGLRLSDRIAELSRYSLALEARD